MLGEEAGLRFGVKPNSSFSPSVLYFSFSPFSAQESEFSISLLVTQLCCIRTEVWPEELSSRHLGNVTLPFSVEMLSLTILCSGVGELSVKVKTEYFRHHRL